MSGLDAKSIIDGGTLFVEFKGAVAEQFVLQELVVFYKVHAILLRKRKCHF